MPPMISISILKVKNVLPFGLVLQSIVVIPYYPQQLPQTSWQISDYPNELDVNIFHCLTTDTSLAACCLHFCNQTATDLFSKKQATVKTANTYGYNFVAARQLPNSQNS